MTAQQEGTHRVVVYVGAVLFAGPNLGVWQSLWEVWVWLPSALWALEPQATLVMTHK